MSRGIFVGDVHGCAEELAELLDRLEVTEQDRLYFVGDLIARGPDSRGVLALARRRGAAAVQGNHEARLLEVWRARGRGQRGPRLSPGHERTLSELDAKDLAWLDALPLWLDVPGHEVRVVHAGVVPGIPIGQQRPEDLLHLRTLRVDGTPSARLDGRLWGERYAGPPHVIFGHNAITGLQLHPCATGLDSGCVYGGSLSALVLPAGTAPPVAAQARAARIVSVPARRAYCPVGRAQ